MVQVRLVLLFILTIAIGSCRKTSDQESTTIINPNVELIIQDISGRIVNSPCAVWGSGNNIYTVYPICFCHLTSEYKVDSLTVLKSNGNRFLELSHDEKTLLIVETAYSDVSCGKLIEFEVETKSRTVILDSSWNISSALYYRDDQHIIFYSYGNPIGNNAGYFLYDKNTNQCQQLFQYFTPARLSEYVNGFDIHPSLPVLLIPLVRFNKSPYILEYNFEQHVLDSLPVTFDLSFNRICLWLRYNKTGKRILYSCYPEYAGGYITNDDSEIGIINRTDLSKQILNVNTIPNGRSVNICPDWSPDESAIVYSSAKLFQSGDRGLYSIYILKNIE